MYERIHEREESGFDIVVWSELYKKAVSHRQSTWDKDAKQGNKVRMNEIPCSDNVTSLKEHKGKYFKDNLIWKHIKWLVSMLSGSIVSYDLQSKTSIREENVELLEAEVNLFSCLLDIPKQTAAALYDCFYTGMGYVRRYWDKYAISEANETGSPVLKHVNSMKIYIDPGVQMTDKSDMRYIFHLEKRNYKVLIKEYPQYAKQIEGRKVNDMVDVVTLQYRVDELVKSVWVSDESQVPARKWIVPNEELDGRGWRMEDGEGVGGLRNNGGVNTIHMGRTGASHMDLPLVLPEQVSVSEEFDNRKTFWYEVSFLAGEDLVLQRPEYIGERSSYHILYYAHNADSAYSKGLAYYMMDLQEIYIILLTTMTVQTMRSQNPEKTLAEGALKNEEIYKAKIGQIGNIAEIYDDWLERHPNKDPIGYVPMPPYSIALRDVMAFAKDSIESQSGVTPTMQGEPIYSQMSGVAAAQFMNAGKIYHKEEQIRYQQFLTDIGYGLMWDICDNRDFPHEVQHLGSDNQMEFVPVNDLEKSPFVFEPERTLVFCEIVENIELLNQIRREQALQMFQLKALSKRDLLEYSGLDNPQRLYENVEEDLGFRQVNEFLANNPQVMQQVQAVMGQAVGGSS